MTTIKEAVKLSHANSRNKGFHDLPEGILEKMKWSVDPDDDSKLAFSEEEIKAVKDAFIAQKIALITSELSEALEANRNNRFADLEALAQSGSSLTPESFTEDFKRNVKDSFEDELSDTFIRLCDLAGWLDINLETHVNLKHRYNAGRPHMHNKKY